MPRPVVAVEEVRRAAERRRFHEIGRVLFASEPRWAPPVAAYERWLFAKSANPYLQAATVARFLVRRGGRVVGRIAAHHADGEADGWFGAFECDDDAEAITALIDAARVWLTERGCTSIRGPATFTTADDAGVLVAGFDHPGGTGRPWHPAYYAAHLRAAGLRPDDVATYPRWSLPAGGTALPGLDAGGPVPPHAGRLADSGLALRGDAGTVAAVPDVSGTLRAAGVGSAWSLARQARAAQWVACTIVRCQGDDRPLLVRGLLAAAAARGYERVWSPVTPTGATTSPDTVHQLFVGELGAAVHPQS